MYVCVILTVQKLKMGERMVFLGGKEYYMSVVSVSTLLVEKVVKKGYL
jgi:hypothetical protein